MRYTIWLLGQVLLGAWVIAVDMLRLHSRMHPAVVEYPLRVTSERELFLFSTSITMTPGTLSLGFREPSEPDGPRLLLVQAVYGADPDEVIASLADMEERLAPRLKSITGGEN